MIVPLTKIFSASIPLTTVAAFAGWKMKSGMTNKPIKVNPLILLRTNPYADRKSVAFQLVA